MVNTLTLTQATEGCLLYKSATGCSNHTILDYRNGYHKLLLFLPDDPPFSSITRAQLVAFFAWLQDGHVSEPDGVAPRGRIRLAPKSIYNIHVALSALWTWGIQEGYVDENLTRTIDAPQFEPPAIEPFTKEDIQAMLKACDHSRTWKTRQHTTTDRPRAR
jgi:site-specific recombinase XerD